MGQMAMAMGKLGTLESFLRQVQSDTNPKPENDPSFKRNPVNSILDTKSFVLHIKMKLKTSSIYFQLQKHQPSITKSRKFKFINHPHETRFSFLGHYNSNKNYHNDPDIINNLKPLTISISNHYTIHSKFMKSRV